MQQTSAECDGLSLHTSQIGRSWFSSGQAEHTGRWNRLSGAPEHAIIHGELLLLLSARQHGWSLSSRLKVTFMLPHKHGKIPHTCCWLCWGVLQHIRRRGLRASALALQEAELRRSGQSHGCRKLRHLYMMVSVLMSTKQTQRVFSRNKMESQFLE